MRVANRGDHSHHPPLKSGGPRLTRVSHRPNGTGYVEHRLNPGCFLKLRALERKATDKPWVGTEWALRQTPVLDFPEGRSAVLRCGARYHSLRGNRGMASKTTTPTSCGARRRHATGGGLTSSSRSQSQLARTARRTRPVPPFATEVAAFRSGVFSMTKTTKKAAKAAQAKTLAKNEGPAKRKAAAKAVQAKTPAKSKAPTKRKAATK
jgi:hypothetical protein